MPFDVSQLRVRWRDFNEATGADQEVDVVADEDADRGYGDEEDGWGPIPPEDFGSSGSGATAW